MESAFVRFRISFNFLLVLLMDHFSDIYAVAIQFRSPSFLQVVITIVNVSFLNQD